MRLNVEASREEIAAFCERWQVTQLAVFGSALREDFGPESDVDLLVSFEESARHTLFDMVRMEEELKTIFGREVDLVERAGVEQSRNHIRREAILQSTETIYAA
ncbi:MAG: nucleotidyltransferase family protein [Nitrospinae bacterium]|nr:nucleotidyltransferase family protein [Nitrospinota bacterium]